MSGDGAGPPPGEVLALNAGSSSLKFALFTPAAGGPECRLRGAYRALGGAARLEARDARGRVLEAGRLSLGGHEAALAHLLGWLPRHLRGRALAAAGHRVVHGGGRFEAPVRVDEEVLAALRGLVHLAPLHMPHCLAGIEALARLRPGLVQVACFDTAFHRTMPWRERAYALPRELHERGVRRYGFHGLSYEHVADVLPALLGERAAGRVVAAHLGHGASLCAMRGGRSVATTMGMTPLEGLPMATRSGSIDPSAVLWLQRNLGLDADGVEELLNHRSGLLGLSGLSASMAELLASELPQAREAVEHFVYHVHRGIAAMAAALGGIDALVFTGGIGENAPAVRARVCREARWLGIELDEAANRANAQRLDAAGSRVAVLRVPADEERVIARHTIALLGHAEETCHG